jgi:hypothetical protein
MVSDGPLEYKDVSNLAASYMTSKPAKPYNKKNALLKSLYILLLKDKGLDVELYSGSIEFNLKGTMNWLYLFVYPNMTIGMFEFTRPWNNVNHLINFVWSRVQQVPNINFAQVIVRLVNGVLDQRPALGISGSLQEIKKALKKIVLELKWMPPAQ